eukprot:CAMPEP_0117430036 /NCGR_PEP_ID=MMETSP0758-20121206/9555_1 /TAXON_ID=63605 /ORGANISM="Percolomonas cosmopolitus, Strain AE-1 (ATCC 50343)" /LENGTH=113 /DNA_ID=CAMNT_0005217613 /DNA_START=520 /DNA_END=857 /DNA_ORIENTATION=+
MDALIKKHRGYLNRRGRDGTGDEDGENWSTVYFPDEIQSNQPQFQIYNKIKKAENDPFEKDRATFIQRMKDYENQSRMRFRRMMHSRPTVDSDSESESDSDTMVDTPMPGGGG